MLSNIEKRFKDLEVRRVAFVERVRALSPDQQVAHPDPKAFSAAEVVAHFALMEGFNLSFLDKAPPKSIKGGKTALRIIGKFALNGMKNTVKGVDTLPQAVPKGPINLEKSAAEWASCRCKIEGYLEQVTDANAPFIKMMWLFGTLSASMYIDLMETHMTYHEARFPKF